MCPWPWNCPLSKVESQWRIQDFVKGVLLQAAEGSRTEALSAEARKIFSPLFFSYQGGLSWHLRALHRCERIAGPGAAMCFRFLLKFRSCNVIAT